ncbi:MAG: rubrerythrin [Hyphomicrobiaceae bacterium]|nr:rubrerythrin [Hyphomicrobiaceae bacterium]
MSKQKLSEMTTIAEILETAVGFERAAEAFYTALIPKVSKNVRYLVEELAEEEAEHVRIFSELAENPDVHAHMADAITRPHADRKFSDAVHTPELGDNPDDQAVLQYALMREHIAMEEYTELAANTEPGPLHDAFQFLANEERKHKAELEAIYYQIVHSGGV